MQKGELFMWEGDGEIYHFVKKDRNGNYIATQGSDEYDPKDSRTFSVIEPDEAQEIYNSDYIFSNAVKSLNSESEAHEFIDNNFSVCEENSEFLSPSTEEGIEFCANLKKPKYAVLLVDGHIGQSDRVLDGIYGTKEEAKEAAKRMRKTLSKGEKSYYGMTYKAVEVNPDGSYPRTK